MHPYFNDPVRHQKRDLNWSLWDDVGPIGSFKSLPVVLSSSKCLGALGGNGYIAARIFVSQCIGPRP